MLAGSGIGILSAMLIACTDDWCSLSGRPIPPINSFEQCANVGFPIMESYPRQCRTSDGRLFVEQIAGESFASSLPVGELNIIVTEPVEGQTVSSVFTIKGEARVFENTVNYRVKDEDGSEILESFVTAMSLDIGQFGPFSAVVDVSAAKGQNLTVEVFQYSAKDGTEIDKVTIQVKSEK